MHFTLWLLVSLIVFVHETKGQTIDQFLEYANSQGDIGPPGPGGLPAPIANDGSYITELDIREDLSNTVTSRRKRGAAGREELRWPNKEVPYEIDANGLSDSDIQTIQQVLSDWGSYTCLLFREGRPEPTSNNYINFIKGFSGCYSWVGSQHQNGKVNEINIYSPECRSAKVLRHLVGHAVGLYHEQSRPDRDSYLRVQQQNVRSGVNGQFNIRATNQRIINEVQYDYRSIMHFGKNYLSRPDLITLETLEPSVQDVIGNAERMTFRDIKSLNILYDCNESCPAQSCPGEGFVGKDCQCWCPSDTDVYQICPSDNSDNNGNNGDTGNNDNNGNTGCGEVFYQSGAMSGTFNTPNYPRNYDNKVVCSWGFRPRIGFSVVIRFDNFELEGSSTCSFDYLKIGSKKYCGRNGPNEIIETSDVDMEFSTDPSVTKRGFSATYIFIPGEANCGNPGFPLNGNKTGDRYTYRSVVTYSCNPGYDLMGSRQITCQSNGQWTAERPTCRIRNSCGDPGAPANGMKTGTVYTLYAVVTFRCNDGYDLSGSSRVICEANGLWSDVTPRCVTSCGRVFHQYQGMTGTFSSPGYPADYGNKRGCTWRFRPENGFSVNIVFTDFSIEGHRTCNYDYVLIQGIRYCGNNRPNPVTLSEGQNILLHSDYSVSTRGFTATYSFVPSPPPTALPQPPTQRPPTQPPPTQSPPVSCPPIAGLQNGQAFVSNNNNIGSTVQFLCNFGYQLEGALTITCYSSGQWSGNVPFCRGTATQSPPPMVPQPTQLPITQDPDSECVDSDPNLCPDFITSCDWDDFIQSECPFTCNLCPGQVQTPTQAPPTQAPPTQAPPTQAPPTQLPPTQAPPTPGVPTQSPNPVPGTECVDSDQDQCPDFITSCDFDEFIQSECPFTCNLCPEASMTMCSSISGLQNGLTFISNNNNIGSTVQFMCNSGYQLEGAFTITCESSGQWSGNVPFCRGLLLCPELVDLSNGQVRRPNSNNVGSVAEFQCDIGFQLQGMSSLICEPPGQWSGDLPSCERIPGPSLVTPSPTPEGDCVDLQADCYLYSTDCHLTVVQDACPLTCGACAAKRRKREVVNKRATNP